MARITKKLLLPVGNYDTEKGAKTEFREIGWVLEFDDGKGNTWEELKINLDALNPQLFTLARAQADKGSSTARVKMYRVERRMQDKSITNEAGGGEDE